MNKLRAEKILTLLERINGEIDALGSTLIKNRIRPIPVRIKANSKGRFN